MMLLLEGLLDADRLEQIRRLLREVDWVDGRTSALGTARSAKNNLQARRDDPRTCEAGALLIDVLRSHALFERAVQPRAFSSPLFSQYGQGMEYGLHLDAAMMSAREPQVRIRADVAVTVFLSERSSYDGGDLVIQDGLGDQSFRGEAGDCILYPASSFHRVAAITRGMRRAGVLWVESMVNDPARREILYDLGASLDYLDVTDVAAPAYRERIRRSYQNLLRMWAKT
jgi:PKHD-type hydroxylase